MLDMRTSPRDGASRLGQAEHDDTLLARNSRIAPGDQHRRARSPPDERRRPLRHVQRALSQMDARSRRPELDRRKRGGRPRLSLDLRLKDVRHLRRAHERARGAGLLGSGRARDDHRAAAQSTGHPRSGRRPRTVRKQGCAPRALDRAAGCLRRAFPNPCRTSR